MDNFVQIKGSCLCGANKFTFSGSLKRFFLCHCSYCQKGTGSAHVANLFSFDGKIEFADSEVPIILYHHKGTRHKRSFCSHCGSPMPTQIQERNMIKIPAGCLDDPIDKRPDAHLFVDSKANWEKDFSLVKEFSGYPGN